MVESTVIKHSGLSGLWIHLVQRKSVTTDPDIATDILCQGQHDSKIRHRIVFPLAAGRPETANTIIGSEPNGSRPILKDHIDMIGQQRVRVARLVNQPVDGKDVFALAANPVRCRGYPKIAVFVKAQVTYCVSGN